MGRNFDDYTLVQPKKHLPKDIQHSVHVCVVVQACKLSQLNLTNMYSHGWLKEDLYYGRVLVWYKCHSANKLLSLDVGYGVMDRVITLSKNFTCRQFCQSRVLQFTHQLSNSQKLINRNSVLKREIKSVSYLFYYSYYDLLWLIEIYILNNSKLFCAILDVR